MSYSNLEQVFIIIGESFYVLRGLLLANWVFLLFDSACKT